MDHADAPPSQASAANPSAASMAQEVSEARTPNVTAWANVRVQAAAAVASRDMYQAELSKAGYGQITTEIKPAPEFYFAEDYHQQYLEKNPDGYCGLGGTGVACPIGLARA